MTERRGRSAGRDRHKETLAALTALRASLESWIGEELDRLVSTGTDDHAEVLERIGAVQRVQLRLMSLEESAGVRDHDPVADEAIDLDVLRDSIGRRLDRLRAAASAKAISEGAERA